MKQVFLSLVIHNHQPVGNLDSVYSRAYSRAYLPMVEKLERHTSVKVALHYSGPLLDWLKSNRRSFLSRVGHLVRRGQVEIVSGGYYEPILPLIPDPDKKGQIKKMNDSIRDEFGSQPSGLWLAERVWEPHLAKPLSECDIKWSLVDEIHFRMVGIDEASLSGYYLTEELGYSLKIFPIRKHLRYAIPWHSVPDIITYFKKEASEDGNKILIHGDDGEKFGIWPGTFRLCWQNGWMEDFFKALEDNQDWLHLTTPGEYIQNHYASGRIYLPCASYDEMMEWSLPPKKSKELRELKQRLESEGRKDILTYLNSGFWRHFLIKYPEINRLHKRMLQAHHKVYEAEWLGAEDIGLDALWKAQCNCPYWHGVYGGIYISDVRAAAYRNLIQAEVAAEQALREKVAIAVNRSAEQPRVRCSSMDFDNDGYEELIADSGKFALYFSPHEGGSLFEWDIRQPAFNILSTVACRPEAYHRELRTTTDLAERGVVAGVNNIVSTKGKRLLKDIAYDYYPRSSLYDHFYSPDMAARDLIRGKCRELGDFIRQPYAFQVERGETSLKIVLTCDGKVNLGNEYMSLSIEKAVYLESGRDEMEIRYRFRNHGKTSARVLFGSEWNINLLGGGHNPDAYYRLAGLDPARSWLDTSGVTAGIKQIGLGNRSVGIELEGSADYAFTLCRYPVESISYSQNGVERVYQASCLFFLIPLVMTPGAEISLGMQWIVKTPAIS